MATITAGRDRSTPLPFTCPSWCVVDHFEYDMPRFDGDRDTVHRSAFTYLRPDGALSGGEGAWEVAAQLAAPELDYAPATIVVDLGESLGHYAELTVETADQFIRDLKTFTARVQQMRDQLAEQNGVQS
ncbi:DUF6907 domain-containing protein [Streptomyces phaeoluteigriseus]|uniref:DUF6907 domain-containing protein n=1 Tax=Streptomyces phaeoluteigriseus TaxID=114686 RepID=UPI0036C55D9C